VNEKKRRLIDDDVIVSLIDDLEMEWWSNGSNGVANAFQIKSSTGPLLHHSVIDSGA